MNVSESNAVFTLLAWIGHRDPATERPTLAAAGAALGFLGERAGQALQLPEDPAAILATLERFATGTPVESPAPQAPAGRRVSPGFYGADRQARPGERCTCGGPAVVVYATDEHGEVGYCGRAGAPPVIPCVFCGTGTRHGDTRCPSYRLVADQTDSAGNGDGDGNADGNDNEDTAGGLPDGRNDRSVA